MRHLTPILLLSLLIATLLISVPAQARREAARASDEGGGAHPAAAAGVLADRGQQPVPANGPAPGAAGVAGAAVRGGDAGSPEAVPAGGPAGRAGTSPVADAAVSALRADLEHLIGSTGWRGVDRWGVMVVSLDQGDTLFAHGGDDLLAPASNLKLYTSAAALHYLGPQFRYNTFLLADGPIEGGVLRGDLVIYGTGDPTLSGRFGNLSRVFRAFADTLKALGVTQVQGDVVGDGSYFAGPGTGEGWKEDYINASYAAPAGALSYAENIATLEIRPAAKAGWRPEIRLVPGGQGMAIVNQATTSSGGRSWVNVSRAGYDGPITVRGQVRRGTGPLLRSLPVPDPARYTAAVFREALEREGIQVTGEVRSVRTAAESPVTGRSVFAPALDRTRPLQVLALHNSPPLLDILEIVNKKSHNLMSEQALRTVARVATGEGSVEGGARAILHLLEQASPGGVPKLAIYDGSGLSPLNRVSARSTIHLLSFMRQSPMWEAFWTTLPEAGASDGLRRMYQTRAQGNLRAKTGTIDHVSALSGFVRASNGELLAFSIISNNVPSTWRAKRVEDAIGARLAAFSRGDAGETASTTATAPKPRSPGATGTAAPARTHRIRRGDTLSGIARQYGTTVAALQRANPGLSPRRLIPGRTIKLP